MPTERRLICAMATPLRADFTPHHELLLEHGRDLLARGCDGLAVFGTSGEGPSLPVADRRVGLEFLLEAGVAPERLIVGVGSACLADAAVLTRHALSVSVPDTLLMPAFFLRAAATEEGVFRFFAEVIERAADPGLRLLLYLNVPFMVYFPPKWKHLARRIIRAAARRTGLSALSISRRRFSAWRASWRRNTCKALRSAGSMKLPSRNTALVFAGEWTSGSIWCEA
jgi:dihydrodipicolinate synthase/N-acetylneuraminate lyase